MSEPGQRVIVWDWRRLKLLTGRYTVQGGLVTVTSPHGRKATQVGGSPPAMLARIMLRELADDYYEERE
jgi:hypothetical protein